MRINEVRQLQKIAGLINEDLDQENPENKVPTSEKVDTISKFQKYLRTLANEIPGIKGIDAKEVQNVANMLDIIKNKLPAGSIAPAIKVANDVVIKRTASL